MKVYIIQFCQLFCYFCLVRRILYPKNSLINRMHFLVCPWLLASWMWYWHFKRRALTVVSVMSRARNSEIKPQCVWMEAWVTTEMCKRSVVVRSFMWRVPACGFDWVWWMSSFTQPVWKYSVEGIKFILMLRRRDVQRREGANCVIIQCPIINV
jgi:hypothetical protein